VARPALFYAGQYLLPAGITGVFLSEGIVETFYHTGQFEAGFHLSEG
jgi:peptidoglycan biosynthesis protein MviN/MurJ (putative lipid II flippase)